MKTLILHDLSIKKMPTLMLDEIKKVYIGIPNRCMCGCSGKYYEEDRMKDFVLNKLKRNEKKGIELIIDNDAYIFTIILSKKQYTIYTN